MDGTAASAPALGKLCLPCQNDHLGPLFSDDCMRKIEQWYRLGSPLHSTSYFPPAWQQSSYTRPLSAFRASADEGCPWCLNIAGCFGRQEQALLEVDLSLGLEYQTPLALSATLLRVTQMTGTTIESSWPAAEVQAYALRHEVGQQYSTVGPSTQSYIDLYRPWIEKKMLDCSDMHRRCSQHQTPRWLWRLIDVAPVTVAGELLSDRVRLSSEPNTSINQRYTALSYCWGGDTHLELTEAKLSAFQKVGVALRDLPKTIREAVLLTRALQVRYLWVDALCIIQDSEQDKSAQLPHMREIFSNSCVTIVASQAESVYDGFLKHPKLFLAPYKMAKQQLGELCFYFPEAYDAYKPGPKEPIQTRAWTLEERLVSRRLLHFTSKGLFWECEDGIQAFDEYSHNYALHTIGLLRIKSPGCFSSNKAAERYKSDLPHLWNDIVERYTRRRLTRSGDRLVAIAGLADELFEAWGLTLGSFYYGLWSNHAVEGLLWQSRKYHEDSSEAERLSTARAPTWSWASVDGPVLFKRRQTILDEVPFRVQLPIDDMHMESQLAASKVAPGRVKAASLMSNAHWPVSLIVECRVMWGKLGELCRPVSVTNSYELQPIGATVERDERGRGAEAYFDCFDEDVPALYKARKFRLLMIPYDNGPRNDVDGTPCKFEGLMVLPLQPEHDNQECAVKCQRLGWFRNIVTGDTNLDSITTICTTILV